MASTSYKALYRRTQFLLQLGRDLEGLAEQTDAPRILRYVQRRLAEALESDLSALFEVDRGDAHLSGASWIAVSAKGRKQLESGANAVTEVSLREQVRSFLVDGRSPEDRELLLVKVPSGARLAAIYAFRRLGRGFGRADAFLGRDASEILGANLRHRERERALAIKERIYSKLMSELRPKDVLYQILHGLKRLLQYDHGGAVYLLSPDRRELRLEAEIVTWTKAKSSRIGQNLRLAPDAERWIATERPPVVIRNSTPAPEAELPASLLAPLLPKEANSPSPRAVLLAVLRRGTEPLGLLQIRARGEAAFSTDDIEVLSPFLAPAALALFNSSMYSSQHDALISAERKTALADLARAISHDLNNAFGVMLPLIDTLRRDLDRGALSDASFRHDVEVIGHYAKYSARIFKGLLSVARGRGEEPRAVDLRGVIDALLFMLAPSLEAARIQVEREFAEPFPHVLARRGEMEQLFLNLIYNARDAMPDGGQLRLRARPEGEGVRIEVADEGRGIPDEIREKIFEPFFTTKETGSGLGLDICRSIVWDYEGRLELTSKVGVGTTASVWLPERSRELAAHTLLPEAAVPHPVAEEAR